MNERIRELAEQATSIVEMVGPQGYTSSYANFDREKFAELIVRECMKVVSDGRFSNTECEGNSHRVSYNNGRYGASSDIKKHFGVAE